MQYMGSKRRIAKYIVPIIHEKLKTSGFTTYVEPFCGGCNIIDKVECEKRIACDNNPYLIALLQNTFLLRFLPDTVPRSHYNEVRESYKQNAHKFPDWYIGAIGFLSSYSGKFFGGFAGSTSGRNYFREMSSNLIRQSDGLCGVEFMCGDYRETCSNIENAVIYCDPPYKGTTSYMYSKGFDSEAFFDWCRDMSKKNIVLISEQTGRYDFECILEVPLNMTVGEDNGQALQNKRIEKLFIYKG